MHDNSLIVLISGRTLQPYTSPSSHSRATTNSTHWSHSAFWTGFARQIGGSRRHPPS